MLLKGFAIHWILSVYTGDSGAGYVPKQTEEDKEVEMLEPSGDPMLM